jgi:hypothetical protein
MTTHKGFYRNFFTLPTEAPARFLRVSPVTSRLFYRAGSAPDPLRNKHFGGMVIPISRPTDQGSALGTAWHMVT